MQLDIAYNTFTKATSISGPNGPILIGKRKKHLLQEKWSVYTSERILFRYSLHTELFSYEAKLVAKVDFENR